MSASDHESVPTRVREVVDQLAAREAEMSRELTMVVESRMEELEKVEPEIRGLLHAAVADNVTQVLERIRADLPPEHDGIPPATREYAQELARHEVPALWLRRAYHLASDAMLSEFFVAVEQLASSGDTKLRVFRHVSSWLHAYVDCATRLVTQLHEHTLAANAERHLTEVNAWVQRVLKGEAVDEAAFTAVTGHLLAGQHLAAVLWVEDVGHGPDRVGLLRGVVAELAGALQSAGSPVVVPTGRAEVLVWFADAVREPWRHVPAVEQVLVESSAVRVALGSAGAGATGFRRSSEQARSLRHLVQIAPSVAHRVLSHDDEGMAVVAMLARDLPATRRWVRDTLGPLAADTEAAQRLRETMRTYLRTGSYAETAEQLQLHRNTVKYRITKVARDRGRDLTHGRLDLELALQVCHVLGASVLAHDPEPTA